MIDYGQGTHLSRFYLIFTEITCRNVGYSIICYKRADELSEAAKSVSIKQQI